MQKMQGRTHASAEKFGAPLTHKCGEIMAPMLCNRYAIRKLGPITAPRQCHVSRMRRDGPARATLE